MSKHKKHHEPQPEHASYKKEHEDDLIIAPKGQSPLRFYLTLGLILFVLLVFMVTGPMMATFEGRSTAGSVVMTWQHPTKGHQEIRGRDFLMTQRRLAVFQSMQGRRNTPEEEEVAFWIMMDEITKAAGMRVTDADLRDALQPVFQDDATFYELTRRFGTTPKEFSELMRSAICQARFKEFFFQGTTRPDPAQVEKRWKAEHQEYAFQFVELPVAKVKDEARQQLPSDEELQQWFDALPEPQKNSYRTEEKVKIEVAYLPLPIESAEVSAKILEKYPRPEVEVLDDLANQYYNQFRYNRFRRETPLEIPPDKAGDPEFAQNAIFHPFEEVEEQCKLEAPAYYSLVDWQKAMSDKIEAGETVDLAAEAEGLGLVFENDGTFRSRQEIVDHEPYGGSTVASAYLRPDVNPGDLARRIAVERTALTFGRLVERQAPEMPEFTAIRDEVADAWVDDRAGSLAVEKLAAVRDSLGEKPEDETVPYRPEATAEAFESAVEAAGFVVSDRDWGERTGTNFQNTPEGLFFRRNPALYALREEEVSQPRLAADKQNAFLVRQAGIRDPDTRRMKPAELDAVRDTLSRELRLEIEGRTFNSQKFFEEQYDWQMVDFGDGEG